MASPQGVSPAAAAEARARVAAALRGLDPYSFWAVPSPGGRSDETVVVGTTGVFLVMPCPLAGVLQFGVTGAAIGPRKIPDLPGLKRRAKVLRSRLGASAVHTPVEPVVCLTHAAVGMPRAVRGVRYVPVDELRRDLGSRPAALDRGRAQRAARVLGMRIAGDDRRNVTEG